MILPPPSPPPPHTLSLHVYHPFHMPRQTDAKNTSRLLIVGVCMTSSSIGCSELRRPAMVRYCLASDVKQTQSLRTHVTVLILSRKLFEGQPERNRQGWGLADREPTAVGG